MKHPGATNNLLNSLFDKTRKILKYVVRRYKCQFFKKYPWLRPEKGEKYTIEDYEKETIAKIQEMIEIYEKHEA